MFIKINSVCVCVLVVYDEMKNAGALNLKHFFDKTKNHNFFTTDKRFSSSQMLM